MKIYKLHDLGVNMWVNLLGSCPKAPLTEIVAHSVFRLRAIPATLQLQTDHKCLSLKCSLGTPSKVRISAV